MLSKKGQQYAWIFSLIIGAVILFLAIFASQKFIGTSTTKTQIDLVREFDILLDPFASVGSIATMSLSKEIEMPIDAEIKFTCDASRNYNTIDLRIKRGKGWSEWLESGFKIRDKYIFSEFLDGRKLWVFSKPFEMPWRVDDLIYIIDKTYCFEGAPENIQREIRALNSDRVGLNGEGCAGGSIEVCFGSRNCEINVDYRLGIIQKESKTLVFSGDALMYAAIFSDLDLYECNFNRLIQRINTQIDINLHKALVLGQSGCNTNALKSDLSAMKSAFEGRLVGNFANVANEVKLSNPKECPVF